MCGIHHILHLHDSIQSRTKSKKSSNFGNQTKRRNLCEEVKKISPLEDRSSYGYEET